MADETEDKLREARRDRIDCRDPNTIPDRDNPVVLVAAGNSVTSAHFQFGFGTGRCENTAFDFRNLTGNHANFSYVGRYYANLNANVVEYYNFARTGFGTRQMQAAIPATEDTCGNQWNRTFAPMVLADAVVRKAKADGRKAYFVADGGVNNTNWTDVLKQLVKCRGMEFVQNALPRSEFTWDAAGGRAGVVTNGGSCTLRVRNPFGRRWDFVRRIDVPTYNGAIHFNTIRDDARDIVNAMIAAGADKIVWMLYYDINPANVDIANFGWLLARRNAPGWLVGLIPPRIDPALQPLIDPMWVGAVRTLVTDLNNAIRARIPVNPKVRVQAALAMLPGDLQVTAIGGSPHPNARGQTKLSEHLDAGFRAI